MKRTFEGGIARAVLTARALTRSEFLGPLIALYKEALEDMRRDGLKIPASPTPLQVADLAQHHVDARGESADLRTEVAAELVAAFALFQDACSSLEQPMPQSKHRDALAAMSSGAFLMGAFATLRTVVVAGHMEAAAYRYVLQDLASEHGRASALAKRRQAARWHREAYAAYKAAVAGRKSRLSPESWARANATKYGKQPETVAKAINRLIKSGE
jgi:hypothetical protein